MKRNACGERKIIIWHLIKQTVAVLTVALLVSSFVPKIVKAEDAWGGVREVSSGNISGIISAANDGAVLKITSDKCSVDVLFTIKSNCLVTLDLQGHTLISNNTNTFNLSSNSALLIKNGTIRINLDTQQNTQGILILNNVSVRGGSCWLGQTDSWIVNKSYIENLSVEDGTVNNGASNNLNPIGKHSGRAEGPYGGSSHPNPAPAMVGSGVTWKVLDSLQADFNQAKSDPGTYNRIIMLKDDSLSSNSTLQAGGITFDLGGYALTTGSYLNIANTSGTDIVRNGTITGNLNTTGTGGTVQLSGLTVSGTINNSGSTDNIVDGTYGGVNTSSGTTNISGGTFTGAVSGSGYKITNGYFRGTVSVNDGAISGGYFVNQPDASYIAPGYDAAPVSVSEGGTTYNYKVCKTPTITFNTNGGSSVDSVVSRTYPSPLPIPSKTNCVFEGWYTDSGLTTKATAGTTIPADTEAVTLYAKWNDAKVTMNGYTYDQTPSTPSFSPSGIYGDITYRYYPEGGSATSSNEWKDITSTTLMPGKYYMYATAAATTSGYPALDTSGNPTAFNISLATISCTADGYTGTYDAASHTISDVSVTSPTSGATVTYSSEENGTYSAEKPTFINAGTYTVYYQVEATGYTSYKGSATVQIDPILLTSVTWSDPEEYIYDGNPHSPTATPAAGVLAGEECAFTYTYKKGSSDEDSATDAGAHTVIISGTTNSNYRVDGTLKYDFAIAPKKIEIDWSGNSLVYNGSEQMPTATIADGSLAGTDTCTVTVSVSTPHTDVGHYLAEAALSNSNYAIKDDKVSFAYDIIGKPITHPDVAVSLDFDTSDQLIVTVTDKSYSPIKTLTLGTDYLYTAIGDKVISVTIQGKGNYSESALWKVNAPEKTPIGDSSMSTKVVVEPSAVELEPALKKVSETEAKKILVSEVNNHPTAPEEKKQEATNIIEDVATHGSGATLGKFDALVSLELKEVPEASVVTEKKESIDEVITSGEDFIGTKIPKAAQVEKYLDLSLYTTYTVYDSSGTEVISSKKQKITDTSSENVSETVTITIPKELRPAAGYVRSYYVLRTHDYGTGGTVEGLQTEILTNVKRNGYVLTFVTDKFSTYSLAYTEQAAPKPSPDDPTPGGGSSGGAVNVDANNAAAYAKALALYNSMLIASPKTGDTNEVMIAVLLIAAGAVLLAMISFVRCMLRRHDK